MCGLEHGRRRIHHLEHPRGRAAYALERLRRSRQPGDQLECHQGDQRDPGEQHSFQSSRVDRRDADHERAPHRESDTQARQALADARGAGARAGELRHLRVRRERAPQLLGRGAVDGQLGSALDQVDDRRLSTPLARPPGGPPHARRASRSARARASPASSSATSRIRPAAGSIHHTSPTVAAPTSSAIANGGTTRSSRSCRESTSPISRASRSPLPNAGRPSGASRSSRS